MTRHPIALACALLACTSALAAPVTMHNFQYGYEAVHSEQFGTLYTGALVGEYNGGAANSFITFCNDLYQHFNWNVTYTDYNLVANGASHGLTIPQADMLGKLYTTAGAIDNHDKSVAFQLAVWELTQDVRPGNLLTGSFSVEDDTKASQLALAQSWLSYATNASSWNNYVVTRLYSPSSQDFLIATPLNPTPTSGKVPEPASGLLAAVALIALAWRRRAA
jgi:hypothetical protein